MQRGSDFKTANVRANGLSFSCIESGEGPLVLALHGFPDLPRTFRHQMRYLAAAGYRVVAPYMRGYFPTDAPEGPYETAALVQDALALMDALSAEPAILIGHDWGAAAVYGAAILAPHKVSKLITIAVPPSAVFVTSLITNPEQQRRSWYMYFFQLPVAEMAVAHNDYAFLERLWLDWSPGWHYPPEEMAALKDTFRQPGVLKAALSYYRHTLNPVNHSSGLAPVRERLRDPIGVPTLYIHGKDDGCIGLETTEGLGKAFSAEVQRKVLDGGHFIHRERPDEVNRLIGEFLQE
ncbi:alpha/beta hydrolase [Geobacter sp.]|uniref:alpha/beta fold hydrolase n=1 Tax=Geobacter sp. TaxID=46610 RepID=UPI00262BE246|nr:alpha/beta hydrolase [Geobacter sp.]